MIYSFPSKAKFMGKLFYLMLVAIITPTVGISQDNTTYSLEDFPRNQIGDNIDSIWNEVASWDSDTTKTAFKKREK